MIADFFSERLEVFLQLGIDRSQIILDPGMGAFISPDYEDSLRVIEHIAFFKEKF